MRDLWIIPALALALATPVAAQLTMTGVGGGFGAPSGGGNAVAFNSTIPTDNSGNNGEALTSLTINNMTVGSGVDRALILLMGFSGAPAPTVTATWDSGGTNQTMTSLVSYLGGGATTVVEIFGLIAPTSGNKTLAISWTGAREAWAVPLDFTHVNQTGGATSFPHSTHNDETLAGNTTAATATITSTTNNYTVAMLITSWLWANSPLQTTIFTPNNSLSNAAYEAQRAVGTASVTFGDTVTAAGHTWTSGAIDIAHD